MNFDRKSAKRIFQFLGMISPVAIALRLFTYWKEIEIATGFFTGKGTACLCYNVFGFAVFFLCLLMAYRKKNYVKTENRRHRDDSVEISPEIGANTLLIQNQEVFEAEEDLPHLFLQGFARKIAIWEGTLSAFTTFLPGFGFLAYALSFLTHPNLSGDPYNLIFAVLSVFSGMFFILNAIQNAPEKSSKKPFFALIPAFWCTVRLVVEYRDITRFVNKGIYVGQFLFIISTLIFFVHQAQLLFGEDRYAAPNTYAYAGMAAAFFGVTCRFPHLLAVLGDRVSMDLIDAASLLMDLAITVFILMKISVIIRKRTHKS